HRLLRNLHAFLKGRIVGGEAESTIGGLYHVEPIALFEPKPGYQLLGENDPRRIADLLDFKLHGGLPELAALYRMYNTQKPGASPKPANLRLPPAPRARRSGARSPTGRPARSSGRGRRARTA